MKGARLIRPDGTTRTHGAMTAQVGQTLTASTSGISDSGGLTDPGYGYQWLADDSRASAPGRWPSDEGYDRRQCVKDMRDWGVMPHVAQRWPVAICPAGRPD